MIPSSAPHTPSSIRHYRSSGSSRSTEPGLLPSGGDGVSFASTRTPSGRRVVTTGLRGLEPSKKMGSPRPSDSSYQTPNQPVRSLQRALCHRLGGSAVAKSVPSRYVRPAALFVRWAQVSEAAVRRSWRLICGAEGNSGAVHIAWVLGRPASPLNIPRIILKLIFPGCL